MWPTFETEHPIEPPLVRDGDMRLATMAFGFTVGFGYFVTWHAIRQTQKTRRLGAYIIMCWLEILVCAIFAIICWLYLIEVIGYSFWFYFTILTMWALQVQFLLQIIVNRICILLPTPSRKFWLKFTIAFWITAINISVYCIWVPAKLQISRKYHDINVWWDRTEKCLYLVTDAILNYMFIRIIKDRLVAMGLKKYDKLVKFNERIILVSLSMDVLIIAMMSYRNDFVYMQFHPVAYMVKLEIEMCMSRLMVKVATGTGVHIYDADHSTSQSNSNSRDPARRATYNPGGRSAVNIQVATQVITHTDHEINLEDHEAHELEERDHKSRALDDSDIESGPGLKTIALVPEDDQESTQTNDTAQKREQWGSPRVEKPQPHGWREVGDQERRAVTFSPPPSEARAHADQDKVEDCNTGTFVSYLGSQNVRVLHSSNRDSNTP
ncbi:hypothetical protein CTheo_3843 [Ceratobasidium theobromae]|uniref:Transmembrane protein n=1 Tax=Ceratobasidium theobromae TaxID=1582974 RepID=A0A5N5QLR7_9AGAM|nr:hypothetical protein CTheo_3843 [Ceratobasidium theobromae]